MDEMEKKETMTSKEMGERKDRISKTKMMIDANASLDDLLKMVTRQRKMAELLLPHVGDRTIKSLCELAVISPALWYRIINDTVRPGQDVLLRLAFVLEMNINETQELLKSGRCAMLTSDNKRDVAIIYGLKNELNLGEMDTVLEAYGLETLVPPEK
ncbi:MAG: helix-turn-helix transcriptional regulator [Clostridia bacterium]|nr:helix-turn-helix transcriptional regulator [Clostridia bacterium]